MISINSLSGYLIGSKFCEPTRIRSPDWTLFCFLQGRFGEGRDAPALLLQQGEQPHPHGHRYAVCIPSIYPST